MGFYEELGVRPVINAAGPLTRLGGNKLAPGVLEAMREASESNVHMGELQAAAGKILADVTGAEAGYVVSGAAAGLTLAAAACMAGMDPAAMDQLPDTTGLKNEIVVQRGHRNAYDHAIRGVRREIRRGWVPGLSRRGRHLRLADRGGDHRADGGGCLPGAGYAGDPVAA